MAPGESAPRFVSWISRWVPGHWRAQVMRDLADEAKTLRRPASTWWMLRHTVAIGTRLRLRMLSRRLPGSEGLLTGFLRADLRASCRQLRRSPSTMAISVTTLAVGVSAVVTVFAVLNRSVLHPLPFADSSRLTAVWRMDPASPDNWLAVAPGDFADWKRESQTFAHLVAGQNISMSFTGFSDGGAPLMRRVSHGWFETLGVTPALGRTFSPSEDVPNGPAVAMLSHETWQRYFAGRASVIGESIELDNVAFTIVGVTPEGYFNPVFGLVDTPAVFVPLGLAAAGESRSATALQVVGQLKTDATLSQARQELLQLSEAQAFAHPETNRQFRATVQPLDENLVRPVRSPLLLLFVAVVGLFIAACGNVANLQLARALSRRQERAVQLALGASRTRLLLQMLAEGTIVAAISGAAAMVLVAISGPAVARLMPAGLLTPRLSFALDASVLIAAGVVTMAAALLSSIPAMLTVLRRPEGTELGAGAVKAVGGRDRRRWATILVAVEMAVAVTLLAGAGLALLGFAHIRGQPPGFKAENALTFRVSTRGPDLQTPESRLVFFDRVREELESTPGVETVGFTNALPIFPQFGQRVMYPAGGPPPDGREPRVSVLSINEGFFDAMGIPLLSGRVVSRDDRRETPPVAVLSVAASRTLFGSDDPVGRRVTMVDGITTRTIEIVGVAGDVRSSADPSTVGTIAYIPWQQGPAPTAMGFVVRSKAQPASMIRLSEAAVHRVNRSMPLYVPRSLAEVAASLEATFRVTAVLLGVFAGVGLLLVATGIYGTISHLVADRRREMGVRMALGASRGRVLNLVIREGLRPAVTGLGIGWVCALGFGRVVAQAVSGTPAFDWPLFLGLPGALLLLCALASIVPALRATRVDPTVALRSDP